MTRLLKINCGPEVSAWLSKQHLELEESSANCDLPVSGMPEGVDLMVIGTVGVDRIEFARSISDWPSAPPAIFTVEDTQLDDFEVRLQATPGIGRNIIASALTERSFNQALLIALDVLAKRRELRIATSPTLQPTNANVSANWLFQCILRDLPEYIYFKDREGRFLAMSDYTASRSGFGNAAKAIGLTDYELFDKEHADEAAADEAQLLNGEKERIEKEERVTWQGNEIWVSSVKRPLVSKSGYTIGTFGISRDITAKKQLSEQLERQHHQLAEELALARSLQESLLDQDIPQFRNSRGKKLLSFHAAHIPSSQLSGDIYQVIRTPSGNAAVFIADAMGHGASAAMVTAMLYAAVNELNSLSDSPGAFMEGINERLFNWLGNRGHVIFASAAFCLIDLENRTLEVCQSGGRHVLIESNPFTDITVNPALGLISHFNFETAQLRLREREQVLFYTDGILEATNERGEAFGIDRLRSSTARDNSPENKLDALIDSLQTFTGKCSVEDDVCLLLVQLV